MYLVDIEKSIKRILTTPLGSRVMEPLFGSKLYTLMDKRVDERWELLFILYVYEAISTNEPRVVLQKVTPKRIGEITIIEITYLIKDTNEIVRTELRYD